MVLQHIKVGGKARPFLFSYRAIRELTTIDLSGKDELEVMAFLGFKHGAVKEAKEAGKEAVLEFQVSDIADWWDEDLNAFIQTQQVLEEMKAQLEKIRAPQNRQQKRSQKK